ncbi:Hcp family type VI secretion system effector [Jannaschia seohaensis]|uniref:Type VI secretion system secreted protein Hcp n=1 Tax=Jannaschia seohaensis TaxID=475081 RepID=A0A2Y9B1I3_9RHOB|nr:type VI secretion system tube protein Hcp [Jannaschia seohaensis]PWJ16560.1 type VI secretion system secreted protein Hcp [Jannaschia seohaensis]SSA48797.1 type VI secretion system secreted protein Hcp [Jannaschia seohaensis]
MPLTAYLKIDDIQGESQRVDHEDEIDIHDIKWNIEQGSAAQVGRGRARARAFVDALYLRKFTDASSPYLALSCMQGKSFKEMILYVRKDSGEAHLDYYTITMENVTISKFETIGVGENEGGQVIEEIVGLVFENVTVKYVVQDDDHNASDEHEITYDIAAGV